MKTSQRNLGQVTVPTMKRYNQVSLFFDESGNLADPENERVGLLVGGVIVFGEYTTAMDGKLASALEKSVRVAGGAFPTDLHATKARANLNPHMETALASSIRSWGEQIGEAFGVALIHRADWYLSGGTFFAERDADNRYVRMLIALVEHLLFVNPAVVTRLAPNANVHLYVASRKYVLCGDARRLTTSAQRQELASQRARLESQGYEVKQSAKHQVYVSQSLERRELSAYLRSACWLQWPTSRLRLARVRVEPINYDDPQRKLSTAGLYVADRVLHQLRRALAQSHSTRPRSQTLPSLVCLPYGPWLGQLARLRSALNGEDASRYLAERMSIVTHQLDVDVDSLVKECDTSARTVLGFTADQVRVLLSEACVNVDEPGHVAAGMRKMSLAESLLTPNAPTDLRVMAEQVRISAANHVGDRNAADAAWEHFVSLEPQLAQFGAAGLRLAAEVRNRRAVSLTDQFRYNEAIQILGALVSSQEQVMATVAAGFGVAPSQMPNRELAACLGSLAQVCAMRRADGDDAQAEACFRRAITLFSARQDIERQWVYLGHLACERGIEGRALWDETAQQIPALQQHRLPIAKPGLQFVLALQAKGLYVFGDVSTVKSFLLACDRQSTLRMYSETALGHHPFGHFYQTLGMMHARLFRETGDEQSRRDAARWFTKATEHMSDGGPLLKALACVARMRRLLEVPDGDALTRDLLAKEMAVMKGILIEGIGDAAWLERDDDRSGGFVGEHDPGPTHDIIKRVKSVIGAFRFNYW